MSSSNATSVDTGAATTSSAPEDTSTTSLPSLTDTTSTTAAAPTSTAETSATTSTAAPPTTSSETTPTTESTTESTTGPTTPSTTEAATPTTTTATTPQTTPTTPSTTSTTSAAAPTTASTTTEEPASTTTSPLSTSTFVTTHVSTDANGSTQFVTITSTETGAAPTDTASTTSSGGGIIQSSDAASSGGLNQSSKIAVSVVVPIAAVALLVVAGIFFWRKRKQRKDAEEERRKEVEDYSYNPNNDPTLPDVNSVGGAYEMKEDSSGYRGWGSTTLGGSTGRKASTTMSGGTPGEALMGDGTRSPEGEILGAMGPSAVDNRGANVARGPSNASSSYSAAGRSDGSADNGVAYGGPPYYDQYDNSNPYVEGTNGPQQVGGQPVIRDNPARRNTRIENPSHYPQQSAGISQNF